MATRFYLRRYFVAEQELAARTIRLLKRSVDKITPITDDLKGDQPKAVEMTCTSGISLLSGYPGTGKTTTMRRSIQSFDAAGMKGLILCPTGKASKRADEVLSTGNCEFKNRPKCLTIHRGLEFSPQEGGFKRNPKNYLDVDYVWMDEGSMAGLSIANSLLAAIDPERTRLVISGDPFQLPSVDPGNVMHDLIMSQVIPGVELRTIFRTGPNSGIAYNAARLLQGELPSHTHHDTGDKFQDFFFTPSNDVEQTKAKIVDYIVNKIPSKMGLDPLKDIQALSPGKKSAVGTVDLNNALRDALNPPKKGQRTYRGFRVGDRVINRRNIFNLGIVNGDVGMVKDVTTSGMLVDFGPGAGADGKGMVEIGGENGDDIYLSFCFTIHSSQGSEFPCVVMPIHKSHYQLLFRNLVYTGWTRARRYCFTLGDPEALSLAINNPVTEKRVTGLQALLRRAA
jgi:exodeoxyribonuclease V alpha subunit